MAVHLFMLYWGMLSFITPPVALGAFAAASLAQASPMRTGFEAMRLGSIIYFIPFFFVLNPALILDGSAEQIVRVLVTATIGVVLLASGLQGYLFGVGKLMTNQVAGLAIRALLVVSGLLFALPGGEYLPFNNIEMAAGGIVIGGPAILLAFFINKRAPAAARA
jgi:TRAP-type uncharacterized transport system fused permease subunit